LSHQKEKQAPVPVVGKHIAFGTGGKHTRNCLINYITSVEDDDVTTHAESVLPMS
jgi:hypothetical protein